MIEIENFTDNQELLGFKLDSPTTSNEKEEKDHYIRIKGWILGKKSPVIGVELLHQDKIIQRADVSIHRSNVLQLYPESKHTENTGFFVLLNTLGLPNKSEIVLRAITKDDSPKIHFATIRYQRRIFKSDYNPILNPLLVNSLGRSGSTWMMRLLSNHPEVAIYNQYPYEVRLAQYWFDKLLFSHDDLFTVKGGKQIKQNSNYTQIFKDPEIVSWLNSSYKQEYLQHSLFFCQNRIDSFYSNQLNKEEKQLKYFGEKFSPQSFQILQTITEIYPSSKEIILVRDFRDMLCSIISFNKTRNYNAFGRKTRQSDSEYIQKVIKQQTEVLLARWQERKDKVYLVRYEDLVVNPIQTLTSIFEYCNIDSDLSTVEQLIKQASNDNDSLNNHRTTLSPKASIGRWRTDLAVDLQQICEEVIGDVLQKFGYSRQ
jgi:hypothetical protein